MYPEIVRFHLKSDGLPPLLGDSDEVGYTNRVPPLRLNHSTRGGDRPISNEIRRSRVHESCTPTSSENDVVVPPIPRPSPHHQHCPPFQTHHPHHTPRLFLLLILILGRRWPSTRAHLFSSLCTASMRAPIAPSLSNQNRSIHLDLPHGMAQIILLSAACIKYKYKFEARRN